MFRHDHYHHIVGIDGVNARLDKLWDLMVRIQEHILDAIQQMETNMAVKFDDVKADLSAYAAAVDAYVQAQNQAHADVDKAVADAIAKDDAGEEVEMKALRDQIAAARAKVPAPPTPPPTFEPSNQ